MSVFGAHLSYYKTVSLKKLSQKVRVERGLRDNSLFESGIRGGLETLKCAGRMLRKVSLEGISMRKTIRSVLSSHTFARAVGPKGKILYVYERKKKVIALFGQTPRLSWPVMEGLGLVMAASNAHGSLNVEVCHEYPRSVEEGPDKLTPQEWGLVKESEPVPIGFGLSPWEMCFNQCFKCIPPRSLPDGELHRVYCPSDSLKFDPRVYRAIRDKRSGLWALDFMNAILASEFCRQHKLFVSGKMVDQMFEYPCRPFPSPVLKLSALSNERGPVIVFSSGNEALISAFYAQCHILSANGWRIYHTPLLFGESGSKLVSMMDGFVVRLFGVQTAEAVGPLVDKVVKEGYRVDVEVEEDDDEEYRLGTQEDISSLTLSESWGASDEDAAINDLEPEEADRLIAQRNRADEPD